MAAVLTEAARASIDWAAQNGVAFDHGKTEAAIFQRRKVTSPTATVTVGNNAIPFNKAATRWLGIWLDSQLTLKEHHAVRLKNGRNAMTRLRRLTGQVGLSPANSRKVMTACIQSDAMFGAELWWKGDHVPRTIGRADELQLLVNQEARAATGCFRTTNLGALSMESGLRAATVQLENRQPRFGLRLLSLPLGDQARGVVGAPTEIGRQLTNALAYAGAMESTVLLEEPETVDAALSSEDGGGEGAARTHHVYGWVADGGWSGWLCSGVEGGILGRHRNSYRLQPGGLRRGVCCPRACPGFGFQKKHNPETGHDLHGCTSGIRRMASDEPGPGQQYALQAGKHIAILRRARPNIIEIRWCPAHQGITGNEKADEWAKIAAEEPDTRGVEWLNYSDRTEVRATPLPRSIANRKRQISEKKWAEARQWAGGRTSKKKYKMPKSQRPDSTVAESTKRIASRFYQIKTGHCLTGQYLNWTKKRATPQCWWCQYPHQTREHLFKECPEWKAQQKILWAEVRKETGRWKSRWKIRDLLADERCGRAVLDFLSTTDVGMWVPAEEDDAMSAVSELEVREWRNEQGAGAEGAGSGDSTVPAHTWLYGVRRNGVGVGRCASFLCSSLCPSRSLFSLL